LLTAHDLLFLCILVFLGRTDPSRSRTYKKGFWLPEGRCTRIPKIIRDMKANGFPPPEFITDGDRTYFLTAIKIHPQYIEIPEDKRETEKQLKSELK